jgi:hypothetical protein
VPAVAAFGQGLSLVAASADSTVKASDAIYHPPSGWVHVRLDWQRTGSGDLTGLQLQVHVIDSLGRVWGDRLQRPTEVWQFYPPQQWQTGEEIRTDCDVNMNPRTPAGRYRVEVQVLDNSGKALSVQAEGMPADRFFVTDVEVH